MPRSALGTALCAARSGALLIRRPRRSRPGWRVPVLRRVTSCRAAYGTWIAPPPHPLTQSSAATRSRDTFFGRCCFPVIYFVRNIFSLWPRWRPRARLAETCRLTWAV